MPRTYPPEAVREACGLYMSGLTYEETARRMRQGGYAAYSPETIKRWAKERGWAGERARLASEEAALAAALDGERQAAEMLGSYIKLRADIQQKRHNGEIPFVEAVNLQLKVDAQIKALIAQKRTRAQVDKPALWLEFMGWMVEDLAEIDPGALAELEPHLDDLKERAKERFAEAA